MMKKTGLFLILLSSFSFGQTGNVGINTTSPSNTLHIKGDGTTNPLRIEGLLPAQNTAGSLVADANGVTRLRTSSSISAVRATGSLTLSNSGTYYNTNVTSAPAEDYDNFNEFSGNTFTALQSGLYMVTIVNTYSQQSAGDGYLGHAVILKNNVIIEDSVNKVTITEATGAPFFITATANTIVKLNAAETLQFQARTYGAGASVTASYSIEIVRLD